MFIIKITGDVGYMKKFSRIICLILAAAIALLSAGCRSNSSTTSELSDGGYDGNGGGITVDVTGGKNQSGGNGSASSGKGGNSSKNNSGTSHSKDNISKIPSNLKGTTVEFYNWNPASEYPQMSQLIKEFERATDVKIKWTVASYENYCVEIAARVAANNSPDIIRFKFMNVAEMELVQPVTNSGFDFSGSEWDHQLMDYYTVNGKTYAVNMTNTLINSPFLLTYNKDLIAMNDYEDPYTLWKKGKWTWSKFIEMCEDYHNSTKNAAYIIYTYDSYCRINGYQGILSYSNGKFGNNLKDTRFIKLLAQANEYKSSGMVKTWDYDGFCSGKYPFMENMAIHLRTANPYFANLKAEGKLGVVPYPTIEGNSTEYASIGELEAYGFPKGAKNIAAAPYFLEYILDADNYDEKSYFFNEQALECYKYVMGLKNRVVHTRYPDGKFNRSDLDPIHGGVDGKSESQITTYVEKVDDLLSTHINNFNNRLSRLSQ